MTDENHIEPRAAPTIALATIPAGQSMSNSVACLGGLGPQRLRMPTAWAAPNLNVVTVQTSTDNVNFFNLHNTKGEEITITVVPGAVIMLADLNIGTSRIDTYVRLRAGTASAPIP